MNKLRRVLHELKSGDAVDPSLGSMMSRRARADLSSGFTLIEMLVVLTVIGLLAAIMAPSAFRRPAYLARERLVAELEQRIARGSADARLSGRPFAVDLKSQPDAETPTFTPVIGVEAKPVLYPDGSSNGGTISVSGRPLILIGWIDGKVHRAAS